jgi:predicted amidophosphoribosyltransferase
MFLGLVKIGFPKYCISCNNSLLANETYLCVNCFFYIPKGELKIAKNTETGKLFENSETFKGGGHLFNFDKDGKAQKILHELKYSNNQKFGEYLGKILANEFDFFFG